MARMWMMRSGGGSLYDAFRKEGIAALGWSELLLLREINQRNTLIEQ